MEITICNDWTVRRSRFVAPTALGVKGGVRPQAAFADATFMGPQSWSPPLT